MALEDYRVIDYPEKTSVDNTDYVLIDSSTNGTNKYQLSRIPAQASAEMAAQVAAEAEAREAADDALQDDIDTRATSAELAAETAAREAADTELSADLSEKTLTISHGKNFLNPADKIANVRFYVINTVGSSIMTTAQNLMNIIKIPVAAGETYTISHVAQYVIGDKDNKAVIVSQVVGDYAEYTVTAPENSAFLWVQVSEAQLSAVAQVEKGNKRTFYEPYTKYSNVQMDGKDMVMVLDIPYFVPNMETPTIVNPSMTKNEFITAFNTALNTYATFNEAHIHSFLKIPALTQGKENQLSWDDIFFVINADFRKEVATSQMSMETICQRINKAFTEKIYRFSDARLSDGNRKYSLECDFQADEPSAIVVGDRLYIYAHLKRIYTEDGITWSQPETIVLSDSGYILHINVNFIDGVYYMIGTDKNSNGDLILYTSTDGINFTYQGIMFKSQFEFSSGKSTANYGNTYLIKEYGSGKFYLYIESQADAQWEINLAIFDDFTTQNQDGTIGSHTIVDNNPIISRPFWEYRRATTSSTSGAISAGNPDFAKLSDNKPLKHNGEYYMYLHSTWNQYSSLLRARSSDLVHWVCDGVLFDNRDIPSAGEMKPGNADHCVIEYKGRTYLFYSYDINDQAHLPYIKYTVDDRPFHVILGLRP